MSKCDCYHTRKKLISGHTGFGPYSRWITVGECWGTKERDECTCGGYTNKCNFYPEKRDNNVETSAIELAFTTEGAIAVLKSMLFRPAARANGKTIMTATIDMALCRAIIALEKELKQEKKDEETDKEDTP